MAEAQAGEAMCQELGGRTQQVHCLFIAAVMVVISLLVRCTSKPKGRTGALRRWQHESS